MYISSNINVCACTYKHVHRQVTYVYILTPKYLHVYTVVMQDIWQLSICMRSNSTHISEFSFTQMYLTHIFISTHSSRAKYFSRQLFHLHVFKLYTHV